MTEEHQLHLDLGIELTPPIEDSSEHTQVIPEQQSTQLPAAPTLDSCFMPTTLQVAAQSSISLREIQLSLIKTITDENYLSVIAATNPDTLPSLVDSVNNAIAGSDNVLIQMAKVAEKSNSVAKVFDYMTRKLDSESSKTVEEAKDEYYSESIQKIKAAIYNKFDKERNENPKTAQDFIEADFKITGADKTNEDA